MDIIYVNDYSPKGLERAGNQVMRMDVGIWTKKKLIIADKRTKENKD